MHLICLAARRKKARRKRAAKDIARCFLVVAVAVRRSKRVRETAQPKKAPHKNPKAAGSDSVAVAAASSPLQTHADVQKPSGYPRAFFVEEKKPGFSEKPSF